MKSEEIGETTSARDVHFAENKAAGPDMFPPRTAWRIVCQRTRSPLSLGSFYRWIGTGKVYAVRLGYRIYVPRAALEDVIKRCLAGERL
jgi:hypothetical protein